jgi:hypothetical protein
MNMVSWHTWHTKILKQEFSRNTYLATCLLTQFNHIREICEGFVIYI